MHNYNRTAVLDMTIKLCPELHIDKQLNYILANNNTWRQLIKMYFAFFYP